MLLGGFKPPTRSLQIQPSSKLGKETSVTTISHYSWLIYSERIFQRHQVSSVTPWPLHLSAVSCSRMTHTGSPPLMGFLQQEWAYWAYWTCWAYCLKHLDSKRDLT